MPFIADYHFAWSSGMFHMDSMAQYTILNYIDFIFSDM